MKRSAVIWGIVGILASATLTAQSVGTTSFEFLKTQYSARGAALGSNLVAIPGDINAIFVNPAVLADLTGSHYTVNYVDHLLDLQGGQLAWATRQEGLGTVGVGLIYFNYGDFEETDEFGAPTGRSFGASEFALAATLSNALGEGFDYGLNVKFIYSALDDYSASAVALDAGLGYTPDFISDLRIGFSIANLGATITNYTEADEKLPLYLRVGFSKRLAHLPLMVTAALNDLTLQTEDNLDLFQRFSLGGEFDVSEQVKFRIGYDNGINQSVKPLGGRNFGGLSAGLGVSVSSFRLDYAFSTYGDLGSQNRLGLTGTF